MSRVRIPLAFYTAVRGYAWHCTNAFFSEADFSSIENRVLACGEDGPMACVFTCGDRVFFARYLNAENYDSNMRSAGYYAVGTARKYEARDIDFKKLFENAVFSRPISRESALLDKFPSYLDYDGGISTDGAMPSESRPEQLDAGALSSIGNWIVHEEGDIVVHISNDIAKPIVEVKIERTPNESHDSIESEGFNISHDSTESGGSNESGAVAYAEIQRQEARREADSESDGQKCSEKFVTKFFHFLGRIFGSSRLPENDYGASDRHDYTLQENHDMTQLDRHGGRCQCPTCHGTGWVYAE